MWYRNACNIHSISTLIYILSPWNQTEYPCTCQSDLNYHFDWFLHCQKPLKKIVLGNIKTKKLSESTLGGLGIMHMWGFFVSGTCDWHSVVYCFGLVEMGEKGNVEP